MYIPELPQLIIFVMEVIMILILLLLGFISLKAFLVIAGTIFIYLPALIVVYLILKALEFRKWWILIILLVLLI